jgi:hypothetical protein
MWNDSQSLELVLQADKWYQAGDLSKALQLMDEAIGLAEGAGAIECVVQWRMHRALLATGSSDDYSELLAATQAALDFYTQQNNPLGRLESLINLAGLMTKIPDKPGAMRYLVEAETLLSSLSPADLDDLSPLRKASAISSEAFLQLRAADLAQLRKYITNEMP